MYSVTQHTTLFFVGGGGSGVVLPTFDGDVEVVPELPCPVVGNQAVPPTIPIEAQICSHKM